MAEQGAACVYADVDGESACTVHCHFAPCPYGGRPPSRVPVHMLCIPDGWDEAAVLGYWRSVCGGRRPLVVHRPPFAGAVHAAARCWCRPRTYEPEMAAADG